ncbi:hypothetical protein SISSUDRAFT_1045388 [Sistotremastrum suecicum HHB10207 ss-3]|uniref:Uncharacterized protein n=1 Tax=Sistotremastrum suecicum HHB10207 ss-3 TaxID=1314776 RepID=A0A166EFA2_9AGAM|nr:hypothetical protein SISSUDRAFT_1045388 [Sistotremastrum suecicum HHB10207 ss-3]
MAIPARVLRYQIFISTSITAAKYSLASALLETPPRLPTMSDSSSHATSNEYERLSSGDLTLLNHTPVKASLTEDGPWIHLEVKSQVAGYPNPPTIVAACTQILIHFPGWSRHHSTHCIGTAVLGKSIGSSRRLRCFWCRTKRLSMDSFLSQWEGRISQFLFLL